MTTAIRDILVDEQGQGLAEYGLSSASSPFSALEPSAS
jgi:hypothetical protein